MKTCLLVSSVIVLFVICCSTIGCSKKQEAPPIQTLLDTFAEAVANRNAESVIGLFVAPDDTPEGQHRQSHIDEMKKDWADASAPTMAISFTNVKFDNASLLEADMVCVGESTDNETVPVKFKVCLLNGEWKIVTMNYTQ